MRMCDQCGDPMPKGEEMFKYHGYSGNCPKPPLKRTSEKISDERAIEILRALAVEAPLDHFEDAELMAASSKGAAAIAAQKELLYALWSAFINYETMTFPGTINTAKFPSIAMQILDLLVRFGRVTRDGDSYRWASHE